MPKAKRNIKIEVAFVEPIGLANEINFEKKFHQCEPDLVTISNTAITIGYQRSSNVSKSKAINKTRLYYLKWIVLALSCLDGCAATPRLKSATYIVDENEEEDLELPPELTCLVYRNLNFRFDRAVVGSCLGDDGFAKTLRIAISYCWAASNAFSDEERLKLLWGSFNSLYRWHAQFQGMSTRQDAQMLDTVNSLFLEGDVLKQALTVFNDVFDSQEYKDFVRWKLVTGDRSRALRIKEDDNLNTLTSKTVRLRTLDKETLEYMRDIGCGDLASKQRLRTVLDEIIPTADEGGSLKRVCMLLCRYIYIFRCDGVHANVEYPVFKIKDDSEKRVLSNILEAAIIDFANWLSANYAQ